MTFTIRAFSPADTEAVITLWHDAGLTRPWNDPRRDIERKLRVQPELFLVAVDADAVVGSTMAGWDGHRGWLSYVATASSRRGEGIAAALIAEAERLLTEAGCPKLMLMVRADNTGEVDFYDRQAYTRDDVAVLGKRLIPDA